MDLNEIKQIDDGLYNWIKKLPIHLENHKTLDWTLEFFNDSKNTAACFKRVADPNVYEKYIGGGYKADYSFAIRVQYSKRDTKTLLDLTKVLHGIYSLMKKEEEDGFPTLKLENATPLTFEMTSSPSDDAGEGTKLATFVAFFSLTYEKKGRFE